MLNKSQINNLNKLGKSVDQANRHLQQIARGVPYLKGFNAATIENRGIRILSKEKQLYAIEKFSCSIQKNKWVKFVPASGAASRMFAHIYSYLDNQKKKDFDFDTYLKQFPKLAHLTTQLTRLPFFELINNHIPKHIRKESSYSSQKYLNHFFDLLINNKQIGYGHLPKGLIPFFRQNKKFYTPFEAHILESIDLFNSSQDIDLHFTIDRKFVDLFKKFENNLTDRYNQNILTTYSFQDAHTDSPVLNMKDQWIKDTKGNLLFRKAGHGALIKNLNSIDADFVLIKNIDNIQLGQSNQSTLYWLKVICGTIIEIKTEINSCLHHLKQNVDQNTLCKALDIIKRYFDPNFQMGNYTELQKFHLLNQYLDRPLRVCAMIKASGNPGGGPFWNILDNRLSLEIFESIEFSLDDKLHQTLTSKSTHFNPVMMACAIRDPKGEKYNLEQFSNSERYMIVNKTLGGQKIKAIEWPGLWNGGMSKWNTLFTEIPASTFNPVKTLSDIIR